MSVEKFQVTADVVGRRLWVRWELDLLSLLSEPTIQLRRRERDFDFGPLLPGDPALVYDSSAFPPPGTEVVEIPGWEESEDGLRIRTEVESVRRPDGSRWLEVLRLTRTTFFDVRGLAVRRRVTVLDPGDSIGGLVPGTTYYYQLEGQGGGVPLEVQRGAATPGDTHGTARTAYDLLPSLHRRHDTVQREVTPGAEAVPEALPRGGQLRRMFDLFGAPLDLIRSQTDDLLGLRDLDRVDHRFLPHLAQWLGWQLDTGAPIAEQRHDLQLAPHMYQLIGTGPGSVLWASRLTGWPCRAKEYIHNVFRTNAPEEPQIWEIFGRTEGPGGWGETFSVTRTEGFDGRPAAALDVADTLWLLWHGNREGRRELWLRREGVDPAPVRLMEGAPDDGPGQLFTDQQPAAVLRDGQVWMFWSSDRAGSWDLWMRQMDSLPAPAPERLSGPRSEDRQPAAAVDGNGDLHLFWQSDRRGKREIWSRVHDGSSWSDPARLSTAEVEDSSPAAALDGAGRLWLFWSADLGDRSRIFARVLDGGAWGPVVPVSDDGQHRDQAPAAALRGGELWLLWHSDRGGAWRLHGQVHDGVDWGAPAVLTTGLAAEKEPALLEEPGGDLRLFYRSREGAARLRSTTVDVDDAEALDRLGHFDDRSHYTFDTGDTDSDWYAPDTVGLYLNPTTVDPAEIAAGVERVRRFMEPFRPVPVRFVPVLEAAEGGELLAPPAPILEELEDGP